jgi:hypothetical protein
MPHLISAAELFVHSMLHIVPSHLKYRDPKYLLEVAYGMNFSPSPSPTPCGELRQAILSLRLQFQGLIKLKLEAVLSYFNPGPSFTTISEIAGTNHCTPRGDWWTYIWYSTIPPTWMLTQHGGG